jgi:ATP-dependent helicase/nuclease subunit A
VTVLLSVLSVIDNPRQDVPLISVLRSPLWGFSADELSEIRTPKKRGFLYGPVLGGGTQRKMRGFLRTLQSWRALAPDLSLEELMGRICAETDLFALCAAMPDGASGGKSCSGSWTSPGNSRPTAGGASSPSPPGFADCGARRGAAGGR